MNVKTEFKELKLKRVYYTNNKKNNFKKTFNEKNYIFPHLIAL